VLELGLDGLGVLADVGAVDVGDGVAIDELLAQRVGIQVRQAGQTAGDGGLGSSRSVRTSSRSR